MVMSSGVRLPLLPTQDLETEVFMEHKQNPPSGEAERKYDRVPAGWQGPV
jgi:hypothetical protein